jgi:hypothetical protein
MIYDWEVSDMTLILSERNRKLEKFFHVMGLSLLMVSLMVTGSISCKKATEEDSAEQDVTVVKTGINEFEGVVKVGLGKYFFIPGAQGIDMIVQGQIESGDASNLIDQEVRVSGEFSPERPSILVVDTIEVKESEKKYRNVFTRTEEAVFDDYVDTKAREEFEVLKALDYKNKEGWEGKEKVKIYGKLEKTTVTEGDEEKDVYNIIVLDEEERQPKRIIVDDISEYTQYYLKKLRLFDQFWFYLEMRETVDWKVRTRTRELFHADVVFAGLY